ncbi:baseplate J/gp47 family protein [Pseudonocardia endophytica]|uniref:Putative phage baseplate assembly protein n=1 Tax=Pseudonocardia endophytica TaxID=401976 RepID=A0A4R1HKF3_PSEEN|nr:baseplate J/gp47 family protein [Pseudonocardia endophytica]TCK22867.1 putative phage baseplate assembly protein [Pseudonocardia endophytica]
MTAPTPGRGRIPVPDLDDRTWAQLVDDVRALIPKYAPQWTDHGPSDLGMTLVELFAWLVEGLTFKLNQVPEKNYAAFLDLLGITRRPATPARTLLRFVPSPGTGADTVASGTRAATRPSGSEAQIVFETDTDLALARRSPDAAAFVADLDGARTPHDLTTALLAPLAPAGTTVVVPPGTVGLLCLGLAQPPTGAFDVHVELDDPLPAGAQPQVTWLHSAAVAPADWPAFVAAADATGGLRRSGAARLTPTAGWTPQKPGDWQLGTEPGGTDPVDRATARFWIGVRIAHAPPSTGASEPATVRIRLAGTDTVAATSALTVRVPETLGRSDGTPFQMFELRNRPVHGPGTVVKVDGTEWTRRDEFPTGPGTWYRLDPVTGEVRFGDHVDLGTGPSTGLEQHHGTVPPAGAAITAHYRYVETAAAANVAPGTVVTLQTPPPGVVAVTNPVGGRGGTDEEPVEDAKARAPELLRNRNRAVTVDDYEYLTAQVPGVTAVRCLPPRTLSETEATAEGGVVGPIGTPWTFAGLSRAPGTVHVLVTPDASLDEPRPTPSIALVHDVRAELDGRLDLAANLVVTGPCYLPIRIRIAARVFQRALDERRVDSADTVYAEIERRAGEFLHPVHGGPDGDGWPAGRSVFASDVYAAVRPPVEIGYVASLVLGAEVPLYHPTGVTFDRKLHRPVPFNDELPTPDTEFGPVVRVAEYEQVCLHEALVVNKAVE